MPLSGFHPVVSTWFSEKFGEPTEPQRLGWPAIAGSRDTLIAAPTGSGKTLAAFLACLDRLVARGLREPLEDQTEILYVSPLKALGNDIHRNLSVPLEELGQVAARLGLELPVIRTAVRSGDTPQNERAKMAKRPPHILITTPESLYILLTSESGRAGLKSVRTVIVDEIHAIAGDKRGAHLALSLERLERLVTVDGGGPRPVRVGLSATQKPIERVGQLLVGAGRPLPAIVDAGHARELDVAIELPPGEELAAVASSEQSGRVYDRVAELVAQHRSTIVFVNTRRMVERLAHALGERLGEDQVVAHHGSLSKKTRLRAEQQLKHGQVRCAVATASLELGIDVGVVDLVVQLGSPRSIATLLQRVGRSGHSLGATPKGRLFAMTRDQLVECAALVRALRNRALDEVCVRDWPLDVLAQQLVAAAACEELGEDEAFALMTGAYPYRDLARKDFDAVLEMLGDGVALRKGRSSAHLHRDRINARIKGRRGARLAAITSGGAIPDNANYTVVQYPEDITVGTVDEDFAIESLPGDIFLLGNTSWRIRRVAQGKVMVEDAKGQAPNIPFWFGEAPARTPELSHEVSELRAEIDRRLAAGEPQPAIAAWARDACSLPMSGAEQLVAYLAASRAALGAMPTETTVIAERFFDEAGGMQLVIHAPLGGRINKAWGLALRKKFCRTFDFELQAAATDDGVVLSLGPMHSFPLETVFEFVKVESLRDTLEQAVLQAPVFGTRWRWNATRSLSLLRFAGGKKVPPFILRMRSDDLMAAVFPQAAACQDNIVGPREVPDHPLIFETMRDCLTEFMDLDGFRGVLERMAAGEIRVIARDTAEPSPLSHELLNANPYAFLDDAPLEERRTRAVSLRRGLSAELADDLGALDPAAIAQVEEEAAPALRDAHELHDALLSLQWLPARDDAALPRFMEELVAMRRAVRARWGDRRMWVAAERVPVVRAAVPEVAFDSEPPTLPFEVEPPEREQAIVAAVRGHMECCGPRTTAELGEQLGVDCELALLQLENEGTVLRGQFRKAQPGVLEWCDRRILSRIHRLTLHKLRREIEPVSAAELTRFLFRWQHVDGDKLHGPQGVDRVIEQLQGFEAAAGAWESEILPARVAHYDPQWVDQLCWSGELCWGRLSPRPVAAGGKRSSPTRAAPITFALRDDLGWLRLAPSATVDAAPVPERSEDGLSAAARELLGYLRARGACFATELGGATGRLPSEVEDALWELVAGGWATADGFASLRGLMDRNSSSRRKVADRRRIAGRRRATLGARRAPAGRWSLLETVTAPEDMQTPEDIADAAARQLLLRYGVVFRDLLARETLLPPWREILVQLRRMEARGEIRGGRFVSGFIGEQYALPEALDALRALRRRPADAAVEYVKVSACDPLNLVGVTSPGPKVAAVLGNAVLYRDGAPLASLEAGEVVMRREPEPGEHVDRALRVYQSPAASPSPPPGERVGVRGQPR